MTRDIPKRIIHRYPGFVLALLNADTPFPDGKAYSTGGEIKYVNGQPIAIPAGRFERGDTPRSLARFAGPIAREWKQRLDEDGIWIHFWCPPYGLCIELPPDLDLNELRAKLPALVGFQVYREAQCTRHSRAQSSSVRRPAGLPER